MKAIHRLLPFAMVSVLLGCHPQGAVPAMPHQPPPLDREVLEGALQPWLHDVSACLADSDVVPGNRARTRTAALQLSIADTGRVQNVMLQNIEDADLGDCIGRKVNGWVFPTGSLTTAEVEIRFDTSSAEVARLRIRPLTRTADARTR